MDSVTYLCLRVIDCGQSELQIPITNTTEAALMDGVSTGQCQW